MVIIAISVKKEKILAKHREFKKFMKAIYLQVAISYNWKMQAVC